jgi:hypothetical protein
VVFRRASALASFAQAAPFPWRAPAFQILAPAPEDFGLTISVMTIRGTDNPETE